MTTPMREEHHARYWSGVFKTFADVPHVRDDPRWLETLDDLADELRQGLAPSTGDRASLPLLVGALGRAGHIVDFGGGLGVDYLSLRRACPTIPVTYTVVDLPVVCVRGRAVIPDPGVRFVDTIPDARADILYANSVLQYCEDWRETLGTLCRRLRPRHALFVRLAAGEESYITMQRNGSGATLPMWILPRGAVVETMAHYGFRTVVAQETAPGPRGGAFWTMLFNQDGGTP